MSHTPYIGRLAPSPTGLLHLGHARTFWIAYERAQQHHGTLLLRNEDLDPQRSREEFAEAMREDLRWLGITWSAELQQSTRIAAYREALNLLLAAGLAYPCTCSRKNLQQATQAPHEDSDDEPIYSGHCRPTAEPTPNSVISTEGRVLGDRSAETCISAPAEFQLYTNYRFRIPTDEPVTFHDGNFGPQSYTPGVDFGDFLIWRKDGLPSYQLACVVDDAFQQITEVVRGRDLLKSTARQILLQRALGMTTPAYFHTDLLRDEHGTRLAKRHDALSLRTLRDQGRTPEHVRAIF